MPGVGRKNFNVNPAEKKSKQSSLLKNWIRLAGIFPGSFAFITGAVLLVYDTESQARDAIANGLREKCPLHPKLAETIKDVQAVYSRKFITEMKVRRDVYPSLIVHTITAGCFRCHDDRQGLAPGGVEFKHPEDIECV